MTFRSLLLSEGIPVETLKAWLVDPQVVLPGTDGEKGSLFDALEDLDLPQCLALCKAIAAAQPDGATCSS